MVAEVSGRFAGQAAEMLATLHKTESSLRRLRESRAAEAGGGGDAGASNADKVAMQLFLDAQVPAHVALSCAFTTMHAAHIWRWHAMCRGAPAGRIPHAAMAFRSGG